VDVHTGVVHRVSSDELLAGRARGDYQARCGIRLLAASLTDLGRWLMLAVRLVSALIPDWWLGEAALSQAPGGRWAPGDTGLALEVAALAEVVQMADSVPVAPPLGAACRVGARARQCARGAAGCHENNGSALLDGSPALLSTDHIITQLHDPIRDGHARS